MSEYELQSLIGSMGGLLGTVISYVIAGVLSSVILTYGIRWFIFRKAGQKGWKALIPFYSDYIYYRIAWDGRIYIALTVGSIVGAVIGSLLGLIHPALGTAVAVICNTAVAGANAIAGMILQFKMARAFGRSDYFGVGLYFLGNVFSAILAFGDAKYKGTQNNDGLGVPQFVNDLGNRAANAASAAAAAAAQQLQNQANKQRQQAAQPAQPAQQPQQSYAAYQQPAQQPTYQQPQAYQPAYQQRPAQQPTYQAQGYPAAPLQSYPQMAEQQPAQRSRRARSTDA